MKYNNLFVCLFVCLFLFNYSVAKAGGDEELLPPVELYFKSINNNQDVIFNASAVSTVFDSSSSTIYPITNNYNLSSYTYLYPLPGEAGGWHFVTSQDKPEFQAVAYGLYKFETNGHFFYLDLRDQRYGVSGSVYTHVDIWFLYDYSTGCFSYSNYGYGDPNFISIENGQYLTIWDLKGKGTPSTSGFEDYEINCNTYLYVKPEYNSENFLVPSLIWGAVPNFSTTGYKIYRSIRPQGMQPGTFSLIATVSSSTFTYLDESLLVNGNQVAYYKVKAYYNSSESGYTTTENISVSGFYKRENTEDKKIPHPFSLDQNYPNPFNPSTEIRYSLDEPSHVKITIINTIGQEVRTLVHTQQGEGKHSVTFHASELPSGIYFYAVYVGDFTAIKKMIYLR